MKCLILSFLIILCIYACNDAESPIRNKQQQGQSVTPVEVKMPHHCNYPTCPYKGKLEFSRSIAEFPEHGESCAIDSVHFIYPEKDYDFIDSLLFTH